MTSRSMSMSDALLRNLPSEWALQLRNSSTPSRWVVGSIVSGLIGAITVGWWTYILPFTRTLRKNDALSTDPGVLRKGTTFESYETPSGHVYPKIRTFFHPHPNADKLPKDIPLLVFTHGLGGSAAQFALLLNSLVNIAPCLAIDLPGCGLSDFKPQNMEAYTTTALAELLHTAIDRFLDKENNQKIVLIGHSMGCSISALLASSTSPLAHLCSDLVLGMIAMCPRSSPLSEHEVKGINFMRKLPLPVFEIMRFLDRRGGIHSASVTRMAGKDADAETRKFQLRFNQQSRSSTYLAMTGAMLLQEQHTISNQEQSLLSKRVWSGIRISLCIVTAKGDTITPPSEALQISTWLDETRKDSVTGDGNSNTRDSPSSPPHLQVRTLGPQISHALPYTPSVVRLLSGIFESFLSSHVSRSLNPGIQLQLLTTTGKWDVKNFEKWRKVLPCSPPIAGVFRSMKTMREVDDEHCPEGFVERFGRNDERLDGVWAVVDISHETPVYDPQGLESRGVKYVKFPTVSKLPPGADDVEGFIGTIDRLRDEWEREHEVEGQEKRTKPTIGVHCHYGYNRTGYLIVCYLVEKLGWKVADAVEAFAKAKPPGIKHDFFVDELYLRYEG